MLFRSLADLSFNPNLSAESFLNLVEYYLQYVESGKMTVDQAEESAMAEWERGQEDW